MGCGMETGV